MDVRMPKLSGIEATRAIAEAAPSTRIVMLTVSDEEEDLYEAIKAGATGYLVKSASSAELIDAVTRVADGDTVFTPGLAGLVLGEFRRIADGPADDPRDQLTDRETEILKMVAKGMSYKQIAERLVISHRTVQNHVQRVLEKLQLHNRVQLTRYAIERGLDAE
jgi:DNA-binding NarL/FixJ family response regulator